MTTFRPPTTAIAVSILSICFSISAEAARKLALEPRMVEVKGEQGYAGAFGAMDDARGQPIILPAGGMFLRDRAAIAQAYGG